MENININLYRQLLVKKAGELLVDLSPELERIAPLVQEYATIKNELSKIGFSDAVESGWDGIAQCMSMFLQREVGGDYTYNANWTWRQKGIFLLRREKKIMTVAALFSMVLDLEPDLNLKDEIFKRNRQASLSGALGDAANEGIEVRRFEYRQKDYVYGLPELFSGGWPMLEHVADDKIKMLLNNKTIEATTQLSIPKVVTYITPDYDKF